MASVFVFLVEGRARYGAHLSVPVILLLANAIHTEEQLLKFHQRSIAERATNSAAISSRIRAPGHRRRAAMDVRTPGPSFTCITECTLQKKDTKLQSK